MKINTKKIIGSIVILLFCLAIQIYSQGNLSEKDLNSIKMIEKDFANAWLENNEKGVLSLFWDDAMLYANGRKPVKGIAEIKRVWFTTSNRVHKLTKYDTKLDEVYGNKNLAYAIGTNQIEWDSMEKGKPEVRKFTAERHFMAIYVKRKGKWKILRRHWNGKLKEVK